MKLYDEIQSKVTMYSSFPIKETMLTEGKTYSVIYVDGGKFALFDDNNHHIEFWDVEFDEYFTSVTEDFNNLIKHLEISCKLNKNIPIKMYDYVFKNYKSFNMIYTKLENRSVEKSFDSIIIKDTAYSTKLTSEELLAKLKEAI